MGGSSSKFGLIAYFADLYVIKLLESCESIAEVIMVFTVLK